MDRTFRMLPILVVAIIALGINSIVFAQSPPAPVVTTEELMDRLIVRTRASKLDSAIEAKTCAVLGICDGRQDMPTKQIAKSETEGIHYFILPLDENSKDVLLALKNSAGAIEIYLTDRKGVLRAAAIVKPSGVRLISNKQAAKKYKNELVFFTEAAAKLPPTR